MICANEQVVLSGQPHHSAPAPATPEGAAVACVSADRVTIASVEQPLRIYHEYLSYIFRKPEALTPQQQLEMGYRDYLQVFPRRQNALCKTPHARSLSLGPSAPPGC